MPEIDSKRYKALQKRRAELDAKRKELLTSYEDADDETAEELAPQMEAVSEQITSVDAELDAVHRLHAQERQAPAATKPANPTSPITVRHRSEDDEWRGFANLADFGRCVRAASLPGGRADERLLSLYRRGDGPMEGADDLRGGERYRAAPTGFHEEGHSAEGYMVPPAARSEMFELILADEDLFGMVNPEPTESNAVDLLADESTPWGATGIQANWRAEGTQMTASRLSTKPRQVRLNEAYAFVLATGELIDDAPRLNSRLQRGASSALRWLLSEAVFRGDGAGKPLGWLNAPAKIAVAKEGSQAADTILAENITKMYSRRLLIPGGRWVWLANSDIVPQLVDLKIGNEPSWQAQNQGLQQAPSGMILGLPLILTEHADTLGDEGDLVLVDLTGYYALRRSTGLQFASSIHLFFDYNIEAFRWLVRVGGQPFLSEAVTPPNSTNTKSSIITLAVRG